MPSQQRFVSAFAAVVVALLVGAQVHAAPPEQLDDRATPVQTATRTRPDPSLTSERRVTIISDSAMAGVRWNGALDGFRGFDADDRLESCRRLVATSCNGREGRRPPTVFNEIRSMSTPGSEDLLVIATGYNDWSGRFAGDVQMILAAARETGFENIAWVNYRDEVSYTLPADGRASNYGAMNAELERVVASGEAPDLQVWDLNGYTRDSVGWFRSDGVHELRFGSWGVADWVSRHVAHLDGRPCAMPWDLRSPQELVCPDPDPLPDQIGFPDLRRLYGL